MNEDAASAPETGSDEPAESPEKAPETSVDRFAHRKLIRLPARHNPKLATIIERVNADPEIYALWVATNVNAVDRLGMTADTGRHQEQRE